MTASLVNRMGTAMRVRRAKLNTAPAQYNGPRVLNQLILRPARDFASVLLALRRHRIAQGPRLLGQPLNLRRSSGRTAMLTTDVAD
jgi:hypothetical protein